MRSIQSLPRFGQRWVLFGVALMLAALACSLPRLTQPETPQPAQPTETPLPTPTPQPLPPMLIETFPMPGEKLPLDGQLKLVFNQPMDQASAESALSSDPSIPAEVKWEDETTLVFRPLQQLKPESSLRLSISTAAKAKNGLGLPQAVNLQYETAAFLRVTQRIPEHTSQEVRADAAVVATFNQPVVPLGAEPSAVQAFSVFSGDGERVEGIGEWLNTSTYLFRPQPAFEAGKGYRVRFDSQLKSLNGAPLQLSEDEWTFTVAPPQVIEVHPRDGENRVRLDSKVTITFNQPMQTASVEEQFALLDAEGKRIDGTFTWNEAATQLTFTPSALLRRQSTYTVILSGKAEALGQVPLQNDLRLSWQTLPTFDLLGTNPINNGEKLPYEAVWFNFSSPLSGRGLEKYFRVSPAVSNLSVWWDEQAWTASLSASFDPSQSYTIEVSPDLPDVYGEKLGRAVQLSFRTAPLPPSLTITAPSYILLLTTNESTLPAQAVNLPRLSLAGGSLSLEEFIRLQAADGYEYFRNFRAANHQTWQQTFELATNRSQRVELWLQPNAQPQKPGLYYLDLEVPGNSSFVNRYLLVVSDVHLTFKLGPQEAFVWAIDRQTLSPIANAPIVIYNESGEVLARGQTNSEGVFRQSVTILSDPWQNVYAVIDQPGSPSFGLAMPNWNAGVDSWEFGVPYQFSPPSLKVYLYTDRPIYRPGQRVYVRAIARQAFNARYWLPEAATLPLRVLNPNGQEIAQLNLPLSEFGTASGEIALPADAQPGTYVIESPLAEYQGVSFDVAAYRKPQFELDFEVERDHLLAGEDITAQLSARYFFDAPAGDLAVHWALYWQPEQEVLSGYVTGQAEKDWFDSKFRSQWLAQMGLFTNLVSEGDAKTDSNGRLTLTIPTPQSDQARRYILEVTAVDEGGLPVSGRTSFFVHPAPLILGLKPDRWFGTVNQPLEAEVLVTDWETRPLSGKALRAEFATIQWVRDETQLDLFGLPRYLPQTQLLGSADVRSGENGIARISFIPSEAGTYLLSVAGEGARSSIILWVGGSGQAIFPNFPNQRLELIPDRQSYEVSQNVKLFIPNPFPTAATALISFERATVIRYEIRQIPPGGMEVENRLSAEDVPNVYVSVTLLGFQENGQLDFRQGYTTLRVSPKEQILNVEAKLQPQRAAPGEEVTLEIEVRDHNGKAVQGEFSVAVVDKAIFALAEPNAVPIPSAFYGDQPLSIRTGIALAVAAWRLVELPGGLGGGGGEMAINVVRQTFPDTAYWTGSLRTDQNGKASLKLTLPDNVTTWKILVRGVDQSTRVGETEVELVATQPLIITPVSPRVWVAGDHVLLAAVVQNNTSESREAQVSLQSASFLLDEGQSASQSVTLPANGRKRVEWWGKVATQGNMEILLSAKAGELSDQVRIGGTDTLIQQYTARQTFSTVGLLEIAGSKVEIVSLPKSVSPHGGNLKVELNPSLAGVILNGLKTIEQDQNQSTEYTLSKVLPNLTAYRLLKATKSAADHTLSEYQKAIQEGIYQLLARQRFDGSWSWWENGNGEPLITAYVLFGLSQAQAEGFTLPQESVDKAIQYLLSSVIQPAQTSDNATLDRLTFIHFALAQAGASDSAAQSQLFERRAQLNPWSEALLAWTFEALNPGSEQAKTLRADLEGQAIRSASGASWQEKSQSWRMTSYQLTVTAMTLYALASYDPTTPLVADAARFLISNQRPTGGWGSSFSTAWAYLALHQVISADAEQESNFEFSALLNGAPLVSGSASQNWLHTAVGEIPLQRLYRDAPNALEIQRQSGKGRLYYRAILQAFVPLDGLQPIQRGFSISRAYRLLGEQCGAKSCPAIQSAKANTRIEVRLTLTVEKNAYYVMVRDYIPAGSELLDTRLLTTQLGALEGELPSQEIDPAHPFKQGWGWQRFSQPMIYDDHVIWTAEYLPAGTYELRYILTLLQPGEYHLRPAEAWEIYFPEVQGSSAGGIFTILP